MPHFWNNILVVTKDELVPSWFTWRALRAQLTRHKDLDFGMKRVLSGGNGRQLLISFDSLPEGIKKALGDPRIIDHILDRFYKTDGEAVKFFNDYDFGDGTYLDVLHQHKYVVNSNVLRALLALKSARTHERQSKGGRLSGIYSSLHQDANSFQTVLEAKYGVKHTLPQNERRFTETLKKFETEGYISLISKKYKNDNSRKVNSETISLLNNLFAGDLFKPTATDVYHNYNSFLKGYLEVINNETGEVYNPADFKSLSDATVKNYMSAWSNKIGTYAKRSGDRQKFMQDFKPYHSLDKPKFAGSIISIDDRQPPFKMADGKRVWFYNGIDLGSEAFTCWVHGRSKEGIIMDFYRQMVRNYAEWNLNLPAELEAEMSLNHSYVNTFLREGAMFEYVRIEANNARGKRIEAYYKPLRYKLEKKREGWLARPFALSESNQLGSAEVKILPYEKIIEGCLRDIETWNNMPHSVHKDKSRWQVFTEMQNPDLKPINYKAILPYIGYKTPTSCKVGIIKLQNSEFLIADNGTVSLGEKLIKLMNVIEGKTIDVYWLDNSKGQVLKALVFLNDRYICEAIAKPTYNRARIEQSETDQINRQIMSSYVSTIEAFGKRQRQSIDRITIIDNTPQPEKHFVMPGLTNKNWVPNTEVEVLPDVETDFQAIYSLPERTFAKNLKDRF